MIYETFGCFLPLFVWPMRDHSYYDIIMHQIRNNK